MGICTISCFTLNFFLYKVMEKLKKKKKENSKGNLRLSLKAAFYWEPVSTAGLPSVLRFSTKTTRHFIPLLALNYVVIPPRIFTL